MALAHAEPIHFHGSVTDLATDVAWVLDEADLKPFIAQLRKKIASQDRDPEMKKLRDAMRAKKSRILVVATVAQEGLFDRCPECRSRECFWHCRDGCSCARHVVTCRCCKTPYETARKPESD